MNLLLTLHIEKILISKKSSKNLGKLEIMYKDFFLKYARK